MKRAVLRSRATRRLSTRNMAGSSAPPRGSRQVEPFFRGGQDIELEDLPWLFTPSMGGVTPLAGVESRSTPPPASPHGEGEEESARAMRDSSRDRRPFRYRADKEVGRNAMAWRSDAGCKGDAFVCGAHGRTVREEIDLRRGRGWKREFGFPGVPRFAGTSIRNEPAILWSHVCAIRRDCHKSRALNLSRTDRLCSCS